MEESFTTRPLVGRLVNLDFRPTRPLTLLGPAWAALCGAIASGGLAWRGQSLLSLILLLFLCDTLLGAWRALWLQADWRAAIRRGLAGPQTWFEVTETPSRFPPRWYRRLTRQLGYVRKTVWPLIDSEIIGMAMTGALAVSVAVVLGQVSLVLTVTAMVLVLLEGQAGIGLGSSLRALVEVALPWLIGQSALGGFSWLSVMFVLLFTLVYRALLGLTAIRPERWIPWSNFTQLALVLLLIVKGAPVGAGVVALGLLAQVMWQARFRADRDSYAYAQHVQSYILIGMLIAGLSLWF